MATVRQWSGCEAAALGRALRLSVRAYAEHLGVAPRTVAKWQALGTAIRPRPETQAILDTALARAAADAQTRFEQLLCGNDAVVPDPAEPTGHRASEWDEMTQLDRRTFLKQGFVATALPALGLDERRHVARAVEDPGRFLDAAVVAAFRRQLHACQADDGRVGPAHTLPVVRRLVHTIAAVARDVRPPVRRSLLTIGADGAEFAGWLCRDTHDPAGAVFWHDRATEWAQETGDLPMQGYVLLRRAQMAYDERDAVRVATLAEAAQQGPWRLPARVRAEVAQQEARGLAMLGEALAEVERKLDESRTHLAAHNPATEHSRLGEHYTAASLTLQTASCYIEAGKPHRAATLYDSALTTGGLSPRDRGYFLARRASALAMAGEPDDAATTGLASVRLAATTSSARTRRELGRALSALQPWQSRPGPRALHEALASGVSAGR